MVNQQFQALFGDPAKQQIPSPFRYKQVHFGAETAPQHWQEAKAKNAVYHIIPRFLHRIWAWFAGYYWHRCGICNRPFGGHESCWANDGKGHSACPDCAVRGKAFTTQVTVDLSFAGR